MLPVTRRREGADVRELFPDEDLALRRVFGGCLARDARSGGCRYPALSTRRSWLLVFFVTASVERVLSLFRPRFRGVCPATS
jgi:hypothetical protein